MELCVMKAEIFLLVGILCSYKQGVHHYSDLCVFNQLVVFAKDPTVVGVALIARIFIRYYYIHSQFVAALA